MAYELENSYGDSRPALRPQVSRLVHGGSESRIKKQAYPAAKGGQAARNK